MRNTQLVPAFYAIGSADFTYTFDNKDRISTEKAVLPDGSVVVKTYTYF